MQEKVKKILASLDISEEIIKSETKNDPELSSFMMEAINSARDIAKSDGGHIKEVEKHKPPEWMEKANFFLEKIYNLPEGWAAGHGSSVPQRSIVFAREILELLEGVEEPIVIPLFSGGVGLQWHFASIRVSEDYVELDELDTLEKQMSVIRGEFRIDSPVVMICKYEIASKIKEISMKYQQQVNPEKDNDVASGLFRKKPL